MISIKVVKKDIVGKRFCSLVVLDNFKQKGNIPNRKTYWLCRCDCGNEFYVAKDSLVKRTIEYCEKCKPQPRRNSKLYHIYYGIKQRCNNPNNPNYCKYGERGISICEEWDKSFDIFENWALQHGYCEGLTIDRIDPYGGYCSENCRWISLSENSARANFNKHKNKTKLNNIYAISPLGDRIEIHNISEFSRKYQLNYSSVSAKIHGRGENTYHGWVFYSDLINNKF